jgi:hypothetical protein
VQNAAKRFFLGCSHLSFLRYFPDQSTHVPAIIAAADGWLAHPVENKRGDPILIASITLSGIDNSAQQLRQFTCAMQAAKLQSAGLGPDQVKLGRTGEFVIAY